MILGRLCSCVYSDIALTRLGYCLTVTAMGFTQIRVDDEVKAWLAGKAKPGETPNTVLRRVARLPRVGQGRPSYMLRPKEER